MQKSLSINILLSNDSNIIQMSTKIYWEKQGADRLCALHCVNSLLQGPFYNEVTLAQLAIDLDKKQHELMLEQGMTKDFLKFMQEDSGNVAMDGYYSIQVLQQALKPYSLNMINIDTIDKNEDLVNKTGFICNSSDHWFTLRRIDKVWYNLNSTNRRMPQIISDFYLSAFLIAVKNGGYQIFSVQGKYPQSSEEMFEYYNKNQMWMPTKRILKYHQKCIKRKGFKPNISGAGADDQLEKALALSMGKKYEKYVSSGEDSDWDDQKPKKKQIKQFAGKGEYMSQEVFVNYEKFQLPSDEIQMIEFMKQSLEESFKNLPKEGVRVAIRHPNGKKQQIVLPMQATIQTLYDYVWCKRPFTSKFYLTNFSNKQKLMDVSIPVFALQDQDGSVFVIVNDQ